MPDWKRLRGTRPTPFELALAQDMANGASTIEAAQRWGMHRSSIADHLRVLRRRLGARTTVHAVAILAASGDIDIHSKEISLCSPSPTT